MVAEVEGVPVAFMMTLPDMNELTRDLNGKLFPFGFVKLLCAQEAQGPHDARAADGRGQADAGDRLASQLAFMMIEYIRRESVAHYGAVRGEFGWILEDNQGMESISHAIEGRRNKVYRSTRRRCEPGRGRASVANRLPSVIDAGRTVSRLRSDTTAGGDSV